MYLLPLILAALLFAPLHAVAESITFTTSGDWSAVNTYSGSVSGGTPSADDTFIIPTGVTVTVTGDITQDGTTAATGIAVQSGGTLAIEVGASDTSRLAVSANEDGMYVADGGTLSLRGRFVCPYNATLTTSQDPCGWLYVSDISFAGAANTMRLLFTDAKHDSVTGATAAQGESYHTETIAALAVGDVIRFGDDNEADPWAPMEDNYWYEVTAVNTTGDDYIEVDLRQGTSDPDGDYGLAWRDVITTTLGADVSIGDRTITLASGAFGATDRLPGRCLYMESGTSGAPVPKAYRILTATDGGAGTDSLLLGSLDGALTSHSSGDAAWVAFCVNAGDSFQVIRPAVLTSSTASKLDSHLLIEGDSTLTASLLTNLGGYGATSGSPGNGEPIRFTTTNPTAVSHVWARDIEGNNSACPTGGNGVSVRLDAVLPPAGVQYLSITGNDSRASCSRMHGLVMNDAPQQTNAPTARNISCRYIGDDCVGSLDTSPADSTSGRIERVRSQFLSNYGTLASAQVVDLNTGTGAQAVDYAVDGVECVACIGSNSSNDSVFGFDATNTAEIAVRDVVAWHANAQAGGEFLVAATNKGAFARYRNLFIVGGAPPSSTELLPHNVDGLVIREVAATSSGSRWLQQNTSAVTNETVALRNALIRDSTFASTGLIRPWPLSGANTVASVHYQNILTHNLRSSNTTTCAAASSNCAVFYVNGTNDATPKTARFISVLHDGSVAAGDLTRGVFYAGGTPGTNYDFGGWLIAGFGGGPGSTFNPTIGAGVTAARPWCLFVNGTDWASGATDVANQIRDRVLGQQQSIDVAFSTSHRGALADNKCGARWDAGITESSWAQAVSGLKPEYAGMLDAVGAPKRWIQLSWSGAGAVGPGASVTCVIGSGLIGTCTIGGS